jgi:hypothetical protein
MKFSNKAKSLPGNVVKKQKKNEKIAENGRKNGRK